MSETLSHKPLVGIRLWDPWSHTPSAGIHLHAIHASRPDKRFPLTRSSSGVHTLHPIPHLDHTAEFLPTGLVVELDDASAQVLPLRLEPTLPSDGIWSSVDDAFSGIAPEGSVPLFAHPIRVPPPGWVCLRASLRRAGSDIPVPWAIMEIRHESRLVAIGLSSPTGETVAAFAPPPERQRPITRSADQPFDRRIWSLDIAFRWSPDRLTDSVAPTLASLASLASQPEVAAQADVADKFKKLHCGPGETILSSGPRPGSSTVILQA